MKICANDLPLSTFICIIIFGSDPQTETELKRGLNGQFGPRFVYESLHGRRQQSGVEISKALCILQKRLSIAINFVNVPRILSVQKNVRHGDWYTLLPVTTQSLGGC